MPGYLSEREAKFLMFAAALSPAEGENLEIGSFKGRSTVALGSVLCAFGLGKIVAVDPHTAPAVTDPDLGEATSTYDDFVRNIKEAGVSDCVEPHQLYSQDLARSWVRPIRFLWIDGDHTYAGAKCDLDLFMPHLAPGALVLMHDVLGTHYGSLRVFTEEVLGSDAFGPAGFSGSIGWAQYRPMDGASWRFRVLRSLLAIPCRQLIPIAKSGRGLHGLNKLRYKIWRPLAPHGAQNPERLARRISVPFEQSGILANRPSN